MRAILVAVVCASSSSCFLWRTKPPVYEPVGFENGLVIQDKVVPEKGPRAALGDEVSVHYEMWLRNGTKVDSSLDRAVPITFVLGDGQVPEGFALGIVGMRLFGRRRMNVPPHLGYGEAGMPPLIPPLATLHLHLELLALVSPVVDPYP